MGFSKHYGFAEPPFSNTPDPRYFFPTRTHQEALSTLRNGIVGKKGFLLLTGDVGTGKTTICRTLLASLRDDDTETALVLNPDLSETEILTAIARDFGLQDDGGSKCRIMDDLFRHLERRARAGGNSLIIIDDAQNLPLRSLEQVRMISNFETDKEKLVQILLVGQQELEAKLLTAAFRQIRQRVAVQARLTPLSSRETRAYILHRLARAGASAGTITFTEEALARIFGETRGYPRSINTLCDQLLATALHRNEKTIDGKAVRERVRALRLRVPWRTRLLARRRAVGVAAAAACAAAAAVVALWLPRVQDRAPTAPAPVAALIMATSQDTPAATPDPQLQAKLAAMEGSVTRLEKRLELLRTSPDLTEPLIRQSATLENSLATARDDSQRLSSLLREKEEALRALATAQAGTPPAAETSHAVRQREVELQAEVERFREESRTRSEQIRHLEKALQTLKGRLGEAERLREEASRNLLEKERALASRSAAAGVEQGAKPVAPSEVELLRAENDQLRKSQKLMEKLAQKTIKAQSDEIEALRKANGQVPPDAAGPSSALPAPDQDLTAAR